MSRFVCVHGHFYQPPRENPWLEAIEQQDSASPYHDWNVRVADECYRPNTRSRILDGEGWIVGIVNNFQRMSFNFGPTLLSWLERYESDVYEAIIEADRRSRDRFSGHGSAMAQAYNHMIMPLANDRDRRTQTIWGMKDFERRFERAAEGMWLPETAADTPTLEALAEQGVRFTVLAPRQAHRIRPVGGGEWEDCSRVGVDPSRAYLCRLPSGKEIVLFFYDGPISQAVAFERLLNDGNHFASRITDALSDRRTWPQLAHIATDGETYGHHHRHGDMALAVALEALEARQDVTLTNYAEFLEKHPPTHEVEIFEGSSWSCVHGVERWRSDCGCCTGGNPRWNQKWRTPLLAALDELRDAMAPLYETEAGRLLKDPWTARDEYIDVMLDRSDASVDAFFARHAKQALSEADVVRALRLLEMQRHAMLMYTSCGWFFDEISGIETVQIMMYAGRAIQLARFTLEVDLEEAFLRTLAQATSNVPEMGNGRAVYERLVRPGMADLAEAGAHFAVSSVFSEHAETTDLYCYTADMLREHRITLGHMKLVVAHARMTSHVTHASEEVTFAVMHAGDHIINGGSRWGLGVEDFDAVVEHLEDTFQSGDIAGVIRLMETEFGDSSFSLGALFRDEQRRVAELISASAIEQIEGLYRSMHDRFVPLVRFLAGIGAPVPSALSLPGRFVTNRAIEQQLGEDEPDLELLGELLEMTKRESIPLDEAEIAYGFESLLSRVAARGCENADDPAAIGRVITVVEMARGLPFEVDLTPAQQLAYDLLNGLCVTGAEQISPLIDRLSGLVRVRRRRS